MEQQELVEEKIVNSNGDVQVHKYYKGRHLMAQGTKSNCYEFFSEESNKTFACKIIAKSSLEEPYIRQQRLTEIKIHKSLHHSNIVEFHHSFEDSGNMYILLEMCHNQSLKEVLLRRNKLTELEVQCYIVQLIQGLKYLHSNRIIHRNLKLKNLYLTEKMELKIGGFLCVIKLENDEEKPTQMWGTPSYMAPEMLDAEIGYSYEVDIWSLGIIIYELLIGKSPFIPNDEETIYEKIKSNDYSFPEDAKISISAKDLISQILNPDPSKRPSLDQILSHDFFNQGTSIPKLLPKSFLSSAPSLSYIIKFMPEAGKDGNILESKQIEYKHEIDIKQQEIQNNIVKNNHIENMEKIKNKNIEELEKIKNLNKKDEYRHIEELEIIKNINIKDKYTHVEEMEKIKNKKELDMKEIEYKLNEQEFKSKIDMKEMEYKLNDQENKHNINMKEMEYKLKEQDNNLKVSMIEKEYKHKQDMYEKEKKHMENMKVIEIDKIKLENEHKLNMFKEKNNHDKEILKLEYENNIKNKELELFKEMLDKIPTESLIELLKPRLNQIIQRILMEQINQQNFNNKNNNFTNQNINLISKNEDINNNLNSITQEEDNYNSELNITTRNL